ncbi:hypothetical protein ACM66B_003972 [Microbotryomycetes sp. NB124-2]
MPVASTSSAMSNSVKQTIPKYKPSAARQRLPPARMTMFRSVVAHPAAPFAVEQQKELKGKGVDKSSTARLSGPQQATYMTAPRPFIPLTNSPTNHKLWNPPAADSKTSRQVEKDESGRLARFASRFSFGNVGATSGNKGGEQEERGQFDVESDLSFLEGTTLQSPGTALGKRDIVGTPKAQKKGKK